MLNGLLSDDCGRYVNDIVQVIFLIIIFIYKIWANIYDVNWFLEMSVNCQLSGFLGDVLRELSI